MSQIPTDPKYMIKRLGSMTLNNSEYGCIRNDAIDMLAALAAERDASLTAKPPAPPRIPRAIVQLLETEEGNLMSLASDGTVWWWSHERGEWLEFGRPLPQTEDAPKGTEEDGVANGSAVDPVVSENFDGDEAAKYIGICKRTLERLDSAGNGPVRVWITPHRYIYRKTDIDVWLSTRTGTDPKGNSNA